MRSYVISTRFVTPLFPLLLVFLILLAACGQTPSSNTANTTPTPTPVALDAYGTPIAFPTTAPQRVISLVPTTSEMLASLNLDSKVVAVDYYTNYPTDLTSLPRVSDVNGKYNVEQIVSLKPDLVLSYGADTKQYDAQLSNLGLHVVDLPSANLTQILQEIGIVGRLTLTRGTAAKVVQKLQQQINVVRATVAGTPMPKVMIEADYSTPGKPYVFGGGSFGDELVQDANAANVFHGNSSGGGFPQVTDEAVISANPQYIVLTEDPQFGGNVDAVYKRPNWSSIEALQTHHVYRLNANLIGRPGPRLVEGLQCLAQLVHPEKFSAALPSDCTATV